MSFYSQILQHFLQRYIHLGLFFFQLLTFFQSWPFIVFELEASIKLV